jgi:chitinase
VFKHIPTTLSTHNGFVYYWDDVAKAPYLYNQAQKLFVTFDDKRSIELRTKHVIDRK